MTAGIFTLLGVLVGGFLNGAVSWQVEKQRNKALARAHLNQFMTELLSVRAYLVVSCASNRWWNEVQPRLPKPLGIEVAGCMPQEYRQGSHLLGVFERAVEFANRHTPPDGNMHEATNESLDECLKVFAEDGARLYLTTMLKVGFRAQLGRSSKLIPGNRAKTRNEADRLVAEWVDLYGHPDAVSATARRDE